MPEYQPVILSQLRDQTNVLRSLREPVAFGVNGVAQRLEFAQPGQIIRGVENLANRRELINATRR